MYARLGCFVDEHAEATPELGVDVRPGALPPEVGVVQGVVLVEEMEIPASSGVIICIFVVLK